MRLYGLFTFGDTPAARRVWMVAAENLRSLLSSPLLRVHHLKASHPEHPYFTPQHLARRLFFPGLPRSSQQELRSGISVHSGEKFGHLFLVRFVRWVDCHELLLFEVCLPIL